MCPQKIANVEQHSDARPHCHHHSKWRTIEKQAFRSGCQTISLVFRFMLVQWRYKFVRTLILSSDLTLHSAIGFLVRLCSDTATCPSLCC